MKLSGRRAQVLDKQALQLARAESDFPREVSDGVFLQESTVDQRQGALHGLPGQRLLRLWCQFGATAQARPVAGGGGRSGGRKIADVARLRWRGRAHRAAVDAGAAHCGEEHAVEACVAGQAGPLTGGSVEGESGVHGASLGGCGR